MAGRQKKAVSKFGKSWNSFHLGDSFSVLKLRGGSCLAQTDDTCVDNGWKIAMSLGGHLHCLFLKRKPHFLFTCIKDFSTVNSSQCSKQIYASFCLYKPFFQCLYQLKNNYMFRGFFCPRFSNYKPLHSKRQQDLCARSRLLMHL